MDRFPEPMVSGLSPDPWTDPSSERAAGSPERSHPMPRFFARHAVCAALLASSLSSAPARAGGPVDTSFQAWRGCLASAFSLRASLSGATLAADAAFRECRENETAYLAALSASPLLDDEDVSRVRPALLVRTKQWLLTSRGNRSL